MRPGVRSFRCSKTTSSFDVLHFDGFESRTCPVSPPPRPRAALQRPAASCLRREGGLASRQRPSERLRTTPRRSADKPADSTGQLTLGCKRPAPNKSPAMRAGSKRHSIRANEQRSGQSIGFHSGRLSTVKSGAYVCHQTDSRCRTGFYANRHIHGLLHRTRRTPPARGAP